MKNEPKPRTQTNPVRRVIQAIVDAHASHRQRHASSGFGFAFADRIDYLDPQHWDEVTQGASVLLRREVLRVIEEYGPENIVPRYAIVFRDKKPVAALAAQILEFSGNRLTKAPAPAGGSSAKRILASWKGAAAPISAAAVSQLRERMLVAGNLLCWGFHGIALAAGERPEEVWPGIAEAIYRIRRAERLSGQTGLVMVKDLTANQTGLEVLKTFSYRPLETDPNMVLEVRPEWRGYDDYLAALDAKYRRNAKDQLKKLASAGCVLESLTVTEMHSAAARLHELYLSVQRNASVRLVTVPATYLPALAQALGSDFRCTVARREGEILGFVTSFKNGDTAIAYYIGFDRTAAAEGLPIYLRLLHTTIDHAIAYRCKRLSLGRTALEPKAALGARPEPMSVWLRHRVQPLNWLLRGVLGSVPHDEAPERSPFKATAAGIHVSEPSINLEGEFPPNAKSR
jgi:hypothetical protein